MVPPDVRNSRKPPPKLEPCAAAVRTGMDWNCDAGEAAGARGSASAAAGRAAPMAKATAMARVGTRRDAAVRDATIQDMGFTLSLPPDSWRRRRDDWSRAHNRDAITT